SIRRSFNFACAVSARFVDSYNFSVTDIRDRVRAFEDLESFNRRIVRRNLPGKIDCIPDGGVLAPESINRKAASMRIEELMQLVEKTDDIQEGNGVVLVGIEVIKIKAVIRRRDRGFFDPGVARAAHCLRKTDQLRAMRTFRPIVAIASERDHPLL